MSALSTDVLLTREVVNEALDPRRTESKFSLAMDAVTKEKNHAGESVKAYFEVLLDVLNSFPVVQTRDGAFDVRILVTIDASKSFINQFRNLIVVIAEVPNAEDFRPHVTAFLEGILGIKKNYPISANAAYLWRDALSFLCREIFISTIAALLANGCWRSVRELLEHQYKVAGSNGEFGYCAFDGFQRSLDVFRNRRLKLNRCSITSDVLNERVKESALTFAQVMQADFILHIYSLFQNRAPVQMWHARTLGFADQHLVTGFDLFVDVRAGKAVDVLATLFDASDWTHFQSQLEAAVSRSVLKNESPLDYMGFISANNALFIH